MQMKNKILFDAWQTRYGDEYEPFTVPPSKKLPYLPRRSRLRADVPTRTGYQKNGKGAGLNRPGSCPSEVNFCDVHLTGANYDTTTAAIYKMWIA
jgi:hypothetical protein